MIAANAEKKMEDTIEADETYIGGKVRGMGAACKGNKTAVVSLVERKGSVRCTIVTQVTAKDLKQVLANNVSRDAVIMTDDPRGYIRAIVPFKAHHSVNHSVGEYVRGEAYTNTV